MCAAPWNSEFIAHNFSRENHSVLAICFRFLLCTIIVFRLIREIEWAVALSPLFIIVTCGALSGLYSLISSPSVQEAFSTAFRSPLVGKVLSLIAPTLTHSKVLCRAGWKRVRPMFEVQGAAVSKACVRLSGDISGKRASGIQPLVYSAVALVLYTVLSWSLTNPSPTPASTVTLKPGYPSLARPFIFVHVPGSGGIKFRFALHASAVEVRANKFLPCYAGLKCAVNTEQEFNRTQIAGLSSVTQLTILQRELRCSTVIGGHFKVSA